ncbi:MAG: TlyA family RNA methyltransferase [Coriobacteriia bacterium]|nr:TlyA family RNA methyltransferase [Coriobacteriia bacterium]
MRLDELLVKRGFFNSRAEAQRAVMAGLVRSDDETLLSQPGLRIEPEASLEVHPTKRFASRGGEKLEKALTVFNLDVTGMRCIDIGAATGGFTDCLLKYGAAEVCAVDVGYGQFAWELRTDGRVRLFERTNISTADPVVLGAPFDLVAIDVSFTRVGRLVKVIEALMVEDGQCLILVKPQFELPKTLVKNGVITEQELHTQAIKSVIENLNRSHLSPRSLTYSPVKGPKGNIEFLLWAQKGGVPDTIHVEEIVKDAHTQLGS